MIKNFAAMPETGHQNFLLIAHMDDGRLLMCGLDWVWYDITPPDKEDEDEQE